MGEFPYPYLDGLVLKRSWAGKVKNVSVLVAIRHRQRRIPADPQRLRGRQRESGGLARLLKAPQGSLLSGIRVIISAACRGLVEAAAELYPDADWQRCVVHFYRNVFCHVPNTKMTDVARMLKASHAQEDRKAAAAKAKDGVARSRAMKLKTGVDLVEQKVAESLTFYAYPSTHWRQIRTNNPLERIIRESRKNPCSSQSHCR